MNSYSSISLNDFKLLVTQLPSVPAAELRTRYCQRFLDVAGEFFQNHIQMLALHVDGWCYEGYLWDCLRSPVVIEHERALKNLRSSSEMRYVMWDVHSRDKILIPDYWKFDRAAVLAVNSDVLAAGLEHLPEDVYIFDQSVNSTLIFTHEQSTAGKPLCVTSGYPGSTT